ncbi:IS6 family transposase, partial [Escherichia coli]|nr:IS6 family transposase [Escherichia coli]
YRFLGKILNNVKKWQIPRFINTDKAPAYGRALALLKREGQASAFYYGDPLGEIRLVSRVFEM